MTSVTIQPNAGLKFNARYRISVNDSVVDLDDPTPSALVPV